MEIKIIYEDENLLAINKPAGVLAHGLAKRQTKEGKEKKREERQGAGEAETVADWLTSRYPEIKKVGDDPENRPGIVHRLDKDTSGIMLIAKTQPYFEYLKSLFQKHEVEKTYRALVYGELTPEEGIIRKPIGIKPGTLKRTVFGGKKIQPAETRYKVLERFKDFSLVEVWPKTGRTHQIRVHLSSIGHPVVGDALYAGKLAKKTDLGLNRQFLHAYSIEFNLEPGKRVKLTADLPEDLDRAIKSLPL